MGGKHLKRLRAEKSKIHFKKKSLPKGQNVTNTAFTVKKILTVEQLKKVDENEPVSSWNVSLKDLLVRLNHYNVTSRLNGLAGIKELLNKHPEILKGPSLQSLISRLLELIIDEEPKVRHTAVELLMYIFNSMPSASVIPFHDILNVHLGCAMTHRNASVQQDSLKLVDIMIKHAPEAVRRNFKTLNKNFLRILKSCFFEAHTGMFKAVGSKQQWGRAKTMMLLRFYKFLVIGFSNSKSEEHYELKSKNVNVSVEQTINLRKSNNQYKSIPDLSMLFKCSESNIRILTDFNSDEFQSLCSLIIPMLFDVWKEFLPNEVASECVLTEEMGELLLIILKIILFLYSKAVTLKDKKLVAWFVSTYGPAFQNSFTFNFPCIPSVSVKESKSKSGSEFSKGPHSCTTQNLLICYLSYLFEIVQKNSNIGAKMEDYLSGILTMTDSVEIEILSKVVEVIINSSNSNDSNVILHRVMEAYSKTMNLEVRQSLSKILLKIVMKEDECVSLIEKNTTDCVKTLCNRLCEPQIFIQELETILKLISKPTGAEVIREIESKAEEIMSNLPFIKIRGTVQLEGQKIIANILYRCSEEVLKRIMEKNLNSILCPEEIKTYVRGIFSHKLKNQ